LTGEAGQVHESVDHTVENDYLRRPGERVAELVNVSVGE
jgi:hypothetical protein